MKTKIESIAHEYQLLVLKKMQEELDRKIERKKLKVRLWLLLIELVLQVVGFAIIIYNSSFWLALGLFILFTGNNIQVFRNVAKEDNFWKQLWGK